MNVNELAQSLRVAHLPGEKILIELVQKGQDAHQAVGYLADGTMVVVEHANKYIGQTVEVEFIRSLQTAAGQMMFAKRVEKKQEPQSHPRKISTGSRDVQNEARDEPKRKQKKQQFQKKPHGSREQQKDTSSKKPLTAADHESNLIELVENS